MQIRRKCWPIRAPQRIGFKRWHGWVLWAADRNSVPVSRAAVVLVAAAPVGRTVPVVVPEFVVSAGRVRSKFLNRTSAILFTTPCPLLKQEGVLVRASRQRIPPPVSGGGRGW